MTTENFKRKLTAILSADVVGYSRLMGDDEAATVKTLETYKGVMSSLIKQHRGRVVDSPGDNLLAEFGSVVDAVQCAVAIQKELQTRNADLPDNRKMEFRIGINLGDVIEEEDRIYGDGVNIAARLEALADPGGICISKTAFDHIESKLPFGYRFIGEQTVKNIAKPIGAYKVLMETRLIDEKEHKAKAPFWKRKVVLSLLIIIILTIVAVIYWNFYLRSPSIEPEEVAVAPEIKQAPKSIAVLPFELISSEKDKEYFADGLSEEILNTVAQIPDLKVTARTSSFSSKFKDKTIQEIAIILDVDYILEGTVRKAGNTIRITAQLIKTADSSHLWSKDYDKELNVTEIFAVQEDIADSVADELKLTLGVGKSIKKRGGTDNMEAYDAYLMGRQRILKDSATSMVEAINYFQKAIDLDNNFALAYVGLADSYMYHMSYSNLSRDEWLPKAKKAIEHALEIDDQLGEVYNSLGLYRLAKSEYIEAEADFKRALELNPNYFDARWNYAAYLYSADRFKESLAWYKKGIELDPLNSGINRSMARALQGLGRFDEAIEQYDKVIEIDPLYPKVYADKGDLYMSLGRLYEAAKMFRKAISLELKVSVHRMSLGTVYMILGDIKQGEYWCEQAKKMNPESIDSINYMFVHSQFFNDEESAKKYGHKLLELTQGKSVGVLSYFQYLDLEKGHYDEAMKWFGDAYPELLNPETLNIGTTNYAAVINYAYALMRTGEIDQANMLLNKCLKYIKTLPRLGIFGYGIADVQIFALQGKTKMALDSLREAVDSGWRMMWQASENERLVPILKPLFKRPQYNAIVQEIKADLNAQLARVRELEKSDPDWLNRIEESQKAN